MLQQNLKNVACPAPPLPQVLCAAQFENHWANANIWTKDKQFTSYGLCACLYF